MFFLLEVLNVLWSSLSFFEDVFITRLRPTGRREQEQDLVVTFLLPFPVTFGGFLRYWPDVCFLLTASHEIDGVRKEKERLTAAWTSHTFGLTAHFSFLTGG